MEPSNEPVSPHKPLEPPWALLEPPRGPQEPHNEPLDSPHKPQEPPQGPLGLQQATPGLFPDYTFKNIKTTFDCHWLSS